MPASAQENCIWTLCQWLQWLSRDTLAIKKSVFTIKKLTTQCGRFSQLLAAGRTVRVSPSAQLTQWFLNMWQLQTIYLTIKSNTRTNTVLSWRFPAWQLPPNTRHKSFTTSPKELQLGKMSTKKLTQKINGSSAWHLVPIKPQPCLNQKLVPTIYLHLLDRTWARDHLWTLHVWFTAFAEKMIKLASMN